VGCNALTGLDAIERVPCTGVACAPATEAGGTDAASDEADVGDAPAGSDARDGGPNDDAGDALACTPVAGDGGTAPCPEGMVLVTPGGRLADGDGGGVDVAPFCMDIDDVTSAAYVSCVTAGACDNRGLDCGGAPGSSPNYGDVSAANHPINCVNHAQAEAYCRAACKRLPTLDEWRWAARGGNNGFAYPWGNDAPSAADTDEKLCWSGKGKRTGTCAAGIFARTSVGDRRNPWRIHDLTGNVTQWTSTGNGGEIVVVGGYWGETDPAKVRSDSFVGVDPSSATDGRGFRCATEPLR
jgi:formylglycine-generating enzyme required for sulfatase activity